MHPSASPKPTMESLNGNPKSRNSLRVRKPVVEKMRRDRINSSIKQLRLLLEKEFQKNQPNSKLEKADILEMTVNYLKQQHLQRTAATGVIKSHFQDYHQGYNRCMEETFRYLALTEKEAPKTRILIDHLNGPLSIAQELKQENLMRKSSCSTPSIWRPW
ncbi:transcription factor HES-5-like [Pelobates fuscus]|uniref:transcription factor HES-5-like n=1 Tax=Pelobates fuscus TaxID=191477 RepID=UPI002FE483B8